MPQFFEIAKKKKKQKKKKKKRPCPASRFKKREGKGAIINSFFFFFSGRVTGIQLLLGIVGYEESNFSSSEWEPILPPWCSS